MKSSLTCTRQQLKDYWFKNIEKIRIEVHWLPIKERCIYKQKRDPVKKLKNPK